MSQSTKHFVRHYVEMVIAMAAGMVVLGGTVRGVLALVGAESPMAGHPGAAALEMAFEMSAGMLIWMRVRGHGWTACLEMCGAMFAPLAVLLPLLWLQVVTAGSMMVLEHAVMLVLMFAVMIRRRDEYSH